MADERKASTLTLESIVSASRDQVSAELGDEAAILNMKDERYYSLNPVGARIWAFLQRPRRVSEVRDLVLAEYDAEPRECERDIFELLEKLKSAELLQVHSAATIPVAPSQAGNR